MEKLLIPQLLPQSYKTYIWKDENLKKQRLQYIEFSFTKSGLTTQIYFLMADFVVGACDVLNLCASSTESRKSFLCSLGNQRDPSQL